jgi:hypothetical protein
VARPTRVRLRAAPSTQSRHYSGLAGSVFACSQINGSLSVKLDNGTYVVVASDKCLEAEENRRFDKLIPAEKLRFPKAKPCLEWRQCNATSKQTKDEKYQPEGRSHLKP